MTSIEPFDIGRVQVVMKSGFETVTCSTSLISRKQPVPDHLECMVIYSQNPKRDKVIALHGRAAGAYFRTPRRWSEAKC